MRSLFFILALALIGCSSAKPRTKWSSPEMRIMINPNGINANDYAKIQNALVVSGKWFVVDRSLAFKAAVQEQTMTRISYPNRFDDREKFARLGRLYGVGGVVQGHIQCGVENAFLKGNYVHCGLYLAIVSTSTGEVIATSEDFQDLNTSIYNMDWLTVSWDDAVEKLNDNFPKNFEQANWTKEMEEFKNVIKEEATREMDSR